MVGPLLNFGATFGVLFFFYDLFCFEVACVFVIYGTCFGTLFLNLVLVISSACSTRACFVLL